MFAETVVQATFYMYFVAFSGGLGLLSAVAIGYKLYKRQQLKESNPARRKRGNA